MIGYCARLTLICGTALSFPVMSEAAAPAAPQSSTSGQFASPAPAGPAGAEEVVVTARKRREVVRDVPISIQTVSGAQLKAAKIAQISDLVAILPTLTISSSGVNSFAEIRGFGTGNNVSFDQAVGKFIDNVSFGRDLDVRLPLFDVQRAELLKGPQVLLYGNSSTAGALNISTVKPGSTLEADGSVAYDFIDREVVSQAGVTVPISPELTLRLAGFEQDLFKGSTYNTLTHANVSTLHNYAGRGILRYTPVSNLEVLLKVEYDHLNQEGDATEPIAQPVAGPPIFLETKLNGVTAINNNVAPFFQRPFNVADSEIYQLDINYQPAIGTFTSTTAYRSYDDALSVPGAFPVPAFNGFVETPYRQVSQELRYHGDFGPLEATAGAFYEYDSLRDVSALDTNLAALGAPLPPFAFNFRLGERPNSASGFGDLTYHLTKRLSVEFGARYTDITRDASQQAFPGNIVPNKTFGIGGGAFSPNPRFDPLFAAFFGSLPHNFNNLHLHEQHFQPQVVLQYKVTNKDQVYFKYVMGAKAGGFDADYLGVPGQVSPAGAHFLPETATGYEVGLKGLTLGNKLDFAVDAYRTDFTDLQTNAFVGVATIAVVTNVGAARTQGFEADLGYTPLPGLRFSATGFYTDAEYLVFPGGACSRAQTIAQPVGCVQNLSGTATPFSSRFAGTLGAEYEMPVGNYVLSAGTLLIGRSKFNVSTNAEPLLEQSGYVQVDAHIDLKPALGDWSVSVFGRDLNNARFLEEGGQVPLTAQGLLGYLSRGRQIGIRAGVKF